MEFNLQQIIATALTAEQVNTFNTLKNKDDNFEILSAEEQAQYTELKKLIAHAKAQQHIIPLKEEFKKVFPQVASHFTADESKAIINKVVANLNASQILEAIVKKNITSTQDGQEVVVGQTAGLTLKELNKALKGFSGGATGDNEGAIAVGTFKLADFPEFTHPKKEGEEFTWEINGVRYGPGWKQKFIDYLVGKDGDTFGGVKALEEITPHLNEDFKKWLEVGKEASGPAKKLGMLYLNKRAFYKYFGLDENKQPLKGVKVAGEKSDAKAPAKAPASAKAPAKAPASAKKTA